MKKLLVLSTAVLLSAFAFSEGVQKPVKVIFDTDMYTDFDDAGALACLHALADAGECEILATVANTRGSMSVAMCEIINAYYGRPDIPVGCVKGIGRGNVHPDAHRACYGATVDKYAKWVRYRNSDDAPDAADVYRKVLSAQPDKSVVICSVGFLTNMRKLVETDRDLVARKVRLWVAMACAYPKGKECNSMTDPESSRIALEGWPTPIVFSDFQYGMDCFAGRVLAESDVRDNPVADVFRGNIPTREAIAKDAGGHLRCCNGMGGRAAWDETAVLAAVRGVDSYFNVHRGTFRMIGKDGENDWVPDEKNGPHVRLTEKTDKAEVGRIIDGLMCRRPAELPRPEHPRPQFERAAWVNLNGPWTYTFDFGQSGLHAGRELFKSKGFGKTILVPFCPESKLSGVGHTDFIPAMWYHRKLAIPADWKGKRISLNFGGVDYESEIFVDGISAGLHYGGSASFSVDLTRYVTPAKTHDLVLRVKDTTSDGQPAGKQCFVYKSQGCHYTRTTGIWQTVWLEAVDPAGLRSCRIVPDLDGRAFVFTPVFVSDRARTLRITVKTADGKPAGSVEAKAVDGVAVVVPLTVVKTWSPEDPHLYDIVYETLDAARKVTDTVKAYAGLRKVSVENGRICLNGKPYYLRFVLDQGFYPDGIWTAPSDAALKRDIELSMAAGFNGARLHQKVFEERFHYWADRLGYLTWGEMSSWGSDPTDVTAARNFIPEWCEVVRRDLNHPSIIAWTPYNETWNFTNVKQHQRTQNDVYELTKAIDPTRPVNGSSGDLHAKTDLWTIHNYDRAPALGAIDRPEGEVWCPTWLHDYASVQDAPYHRYDGQPYLIDEFGGLGWIPPERRAADNTWGYGNAIKTEEEFFSILKAEVDQIKAVKRICGYCYTQLTDVEQEQNGVYYYDRTPKFDVNKFKEVFGK